MSADSRSSGSILLRAALCTVIAFTLTPVGTAQSVMPQVEDLVNQKKPDEAIALLQKEVERHPDQTDLQAALGNVAARAGRYDLTVTTFQKVLDSLGEDAKAKGDLYLRIGEVYRRKADWNLAIENLRSARALVPDDSRVILTLSLALDAAELPADARREYEAFLTLNPDHLVALNNLAFLLAKQNGDLDRALKLAQRARAVKPGNPDVTDTIGWIYLKKNLPDNAIAEFNQAIQAMPSLALYRYHLGMAFSQKGDNDGAIRELRTALTLDPSSEDRNKIRQLLDRLQR